MKTLFPFYILFSSVCLAQALDINYNLRLIENGKIRDVKETVKKNQKRNSHDESYLLLDAIITEDGDEAVEKFDDFIKKYPQSSLSQIAINRLYSFNYSIGQYKKANEYYTLLKKGFPDSKYLSEMESVKFSDTYKPDEKLKGNNSAFESSNPKLLFSIQVGAFTNSRNAEILARKIRAKKYFVRISQKIIENKKFSIVLVGKYDSIDKAERVLPRLNKQFSVQGKIFSESK